MTETTQIEGPIHVSFKQVKNTAPAGRYKMLFAGYEFITSSEKGTPGVRLRLAFDPSVHKEYEKKTVFDQLWFTPNSMNMYLSFLLQCKINQEMLREEPVDPPQTYEDGSPVTKCVYSTEEQLKSIYGNPVYADIIEEDYEGTAADGVSKEKRWVNRVAPRGYSKV